MCRHLAFLGEPQALGALLVEPAHSLLRQSWAPRRQRHGTVNADGFGVGWYADGDPVPARYRRAGPIWADQSVADLARVVRSRAAPASRLNLLLTDGETIAATAWGDTLWYLTAPSRSTVVASEPYDDDPRWREVPDRTLLAAGATDILLTPLKEHAA
ncbi:class II glutamine amidotransferase domain-containing protein [Streptomyces lasiicapitis]|uniref:hypothetical protein n=1 Tax=Streptomyces lasiicapitis TaxID=1923961 RepID=UPI003697D34E